MSGNKRVTEAVWISALFAGLIGSGGCGLIGRPASPGQILHNQDPVYQRAYSLYVPSHYRHEARWPLVIVCHGGGAFDSAAREIDNWRRLAEREGFVLAAPDLRRPKGLRTDNRAPEQTLAENEGFILSIVRSARGAHSIDDTRVFLCGSGTGALPALYVGLRHPDVWRAICVRQPSFRPELLDRCVPFLDPYQPIQVLCYRGDLMGRKAAEACVMWLRDHELNLTIVEQPGTTGRDLGVVSSFVSQVLSRQPWIRIQIRDHSADAMTVGLIAKTSFTPAKLHWDFGDGESSTEAAPFHKFSQPGRYTVTLSIWASGSRPHQRQVEISVPRMRLGVQPPPDK